MYHGDLRLGDTIDVKFTTRSFSTGAPTQLAGTPVISAYPGNSTTPLTAGITLTVDFGTVTGLNNARVVATSGNGYATATNYALVITTGTVGGVSVVGEVVGSFSIENRSAVMPTTAGRTLDVSSTGEAGIDWANIGGPTTAQTLSGTTIKTATDVETDTADIQTRLPAALTAGGNMKSDALALSGDTVAADNAESFFDGTGYAGTNNVIPSVTTVTGNVNGSVASVTGAVGSVTGNVEGNVVGSVANVTGNVSGSVGSVTGAINTAAGVITTLDGLDTAQDAQHAITQSDIAALNDISVAQILTTAITEAYRANGAAPTLAQFISEVLAHLGETTISGTTKTINKLDHVTAAETFTLDDATTPSSITRAT